jgi:hypothetical protein
LVAETVMMEKRVKVLEVTMSELKSALQVVVQQVQQRGLILSELSKQLGLKETSHESEKSNLSVKKPKFVENEISIESLKNSLEQLDRKFPATTTVAPSVTKNHTSVNEEIEEINDSSNDGGVKIVIEAPMDDDGDEEVHIKESERGSETMILTTAERFEAVNCEVSLKKMSEMHRREHVVSLEPPPEPPDSSVADQPVVVRSRRELPAKPPYRLTTALPRRASLHKPPYLNGGVYETLRVIVVDGEKDLERVRVKWVIYGLDISLNLMGHMYVLVPFILQRNRGIHVSSSGQYTSSLLSHISPNGHHFSSDLHNVNTIAIHVLFPLIDGLVISFILIMGRAHTYEVHECKRFLQGSIDYHKIKLKPHTSDNLSLAWVNMIMKVDDTILLVEGSFVFVRTCDRIILVLTFHFWNHHEVKTQGTFKANYIAAPTTGTNVLDFLVEIVLQKELKNEVLVSIPRGTVIVVGPHDESMVLNQLLRQNSVEGILKEKVQCYFIVITIVELLRAMDMDGVDATNDVAVFELLVHHLEIMLYYLNEGNFLVQHNGLFKLGGDHSTSLVELLAFNLIICNWVTVRFNVKAQNERVVDLCQWMTSKEMSPDSARSMQNKKDLIKQFVMVILVHLELELDNLGKALLVGKSLLIF